MSKMIQGNQSIEKNKQRLLDFMCTETITPIGLGKIKYIRGSFLWNKVRIQNEFVTTVKNALVKKVCGVFKP